MAVYMRGWCSSRFGPVRAESVLVVPPVIEPLTLADAKLRAGLDWATGDPRDALMTGFIRAARERVERDTGYALLTQTRDVFVDWLPDRFELPMFSRPLQSVASITSWDPEDAPHVLDADAYVVDVSAQRIARAAGASWPVDLRDIRPWAIRVVVGWETPAEIPPLLVHAVGVLTAHYATVGRDAVITGTIAALTPLGYDEIIAGYRPIGV